MSEISDYVVGVDGCRGGWVAVALAGTTWSARIHSTFEELVACYSDASRIAIDIPIGLSTGIRRHADVAAREMLQHRQTSVFWSPDPRILDFPDMSAANRFLWDLELKGISIQTWCILPKIREVNRAMTPERQERIIEVHPEVSFAALAGAPMEHPKDGPAGYSERAAWLQNDIGLELPDRRLAFKVARPAKPDDLLDALIAAWSARRDANRMAVRLPGTPEYDQTGLRMEIIY